MEKLIITAAICGAEVTKAQNPAVPYTVAEMVREARSAYDAGAAIIHVHVRWDDGTPTQDRERGTCNFGDEIFDNTMPTMRAFGKRMIENHIKPEYECFEMGHLDTILTMTRKGEVPGAPMQFNFVLGVPGCSPATVQNLVWLASAIPAGSTWTATGVGRSAFTLAAPAIVMGGNVRVGFEDNLYLSRGVKARSNGELVEKVVRLSRELGREIASPAEARAILGLVGGPNCPIK